MTIKSEISLENFEAWSGGRSTLNKIINEGKCSQLESMLEEMYPDGMTDTELNDLLWHDSDTVFEWLDIRTYDQIKEELEEKKAELEDLQSDYEFDTSDEDMTAEEKQEIYHADYEDDMEELKAEIAKLEEELDAA
jgi:hypothetical protein